MDLKIRKLVNFEEEIRIEGDREATPPLRVFGVAAVVKNPWAGRGYVADLKPEIRAFAPNLGELLTARIVALAGGAGKIEAYGKAPWPVSTANRNMPPPSFTLSALAISTAKRLAPRAAWASPTRADPPTPSCKFR